MFALFSMYVFHIFIIYQQPQRSALHNLWFMKRAGCRI